MRNLTLTAKNIVVWGFFLIGSAVQPYQSNAYVVLTGNLLDPDIVIDNKQTGGHKAIVNLGNVTMYGSRPFKKSWVRLATTAPALSTTLTLTENPGWSAGSRIVLSQTEYASWNATATEVETNYVSAVSTDGKTLTLRTPLKYRHYAGPLTASTTSPLASRRLAAAVGLLTRNIVVMGDISASHFGGHIYTGKTSTGAGVGLVNWQGMLTLSGVEFRNMGKGGLTSYAINIELYNGGALVKKAHSITNCSFANGFNGGIMSHGSINTIIADNVVSGTTYHGIFMDPATKGASIRNNLVVGNYLSPYLYRGGRELKTSVGTYNQGGIVITSSVLTGTVLTDNYVSGMYDMGFIIYGMDCTATGSDVWMRNNEAAGTVVGFFIMGYGTAKGQCKWVSGVTSWKAAHLGVFASDQRGNFRLSNALIADSHIGFNAYMGVSMTGSSLQYAEVLNSTLVGASPASTCTSSLTCRALGRIDKWGKEPCASSWGGGFRRVGVQIPQFTNDALSSSALDRTANFPMVNIGWGGSSIPWDVTYGAPIAPFSQFHLNRVTFAGFAAADCGLKSAALGVGPKEIDFTVPVLARRIAWDGVEAAAKISMGANIRPMFLDSDGSLLGGVAGSTLLSNAARVGVSEPSCTPSLAFDNGTVCPFTYRTASLVNIDMRNGGSPMAIVVMGVENYQQATDVQRLASSYGPVDARDIPRHPVPSELDHGFGLSLEDMTPDTNNFHVLPGSHTLIHPRATEPVQSRIFFNSPNVADKVLMQYFVTKPNSQSFFIDGKAVKTRNELNAYAVILPPLYLPTLLSASQRPLYAVLAVSRAVS